MESTRSRPRTAQVFILFPPKSPGCEGTGYNVNQTVIDEYLGRVPAARSDVYNEYYNNYGVDLVVGPTHNCDYIKWTVRMYNLYLGQECE